MSIALERHPFGGYLALFGSILLGLAAVFLCNYCWLSASLRESEADYYLKMGYYYKECGWTEKARHALEHAIAVAPESEPGLAASIYLRARIPKDPVCAEAVQANINAYNLNYYGHQREAAIAFEKVIAAYPDFEWPYGNLGGIYVDQGRYNEAVVVLKKALAINPSYANAWSHLARAYEGLNHTSEAEACQKNFDRLLPAPLEQTP